MYNIVTELIDLLTVYHDFLLFDLSLGSVHTNTVKKLSLFNSFEETLCLKMMQFEHSTVK